MKKRFFADVFAVFSCLILLAFAAPSLSLIFPTTTNTALTSVPINASINEANLASINYEWNGVNYSIYDNNLVLIMNLDNVSSLSENSTTVRDFSRYGNNGTPLGTSWTSSGKYRGGYSFDGVGSDRINISSSQSINSTTFTVSAWIKAAAWRANRWEGSIVNDDGTEGAMLAGFFFRSGNNGNLSFGIRQDGNADGDGQDAEDSWQEVKSNSLMSAGNWHHVVGRYDGSELKIYINGISVGSASASNYVRNPNPMTIGNGYDMTREFNGVIDEVRIWNRSLNDQEIYEQYISNLNKFNSTHWFFYANQSGTATSVLNDGIYYYQIYSADTSGTQGSTTRTSITVDATYPKINFMSPTQNNATTQTKTSVDVNVSIEELNLKSLTYNWNGTNYTIYSNDLVLMMNFDNVSALGENQTSVVDLSSSQRNGTMVGNALISSNSKYGNAIYFDGADDVMSLTTFAKPSAMTISAWIKSNVTGDREIVTWGDESVAEDKAIFRISNGYALFGINDHGVGWNSVQSSSTVNDNSWHHVVMTITAATAVSFYIDGDLKGSGTVGRTYTSGTQVVYVGGLKNGATYVDDFNGTIDELRIWNKTLSATEVYQQYVSNLKKINSTHWEFYANQSKNATTGLDNGPYTYQVFASDDAGNANSTEIRTITIGSISTTDTTLPSVKFTQPTPENATTQSATSIYVNLTSNDANPHYSFADFDRSLMGWWRMESVNSSAVFDSSDYAVALTKTNVIINSSSGIFGNGSLFNGSSSYLRAGSFVSLSSNMAISAWIKTSSSAKQFIVQQNRNAANFENEYVFQISSGNINFWDYGTGEFGFDENSSSSKLINDSMWHHVVFIKRGTSGEFFIDGVLNGTKNASQDITYGSSDLVIGRDQRDSTFYFNGSIDEVMIFNRSLSSQEVLALYNSTANQYQNNFTNLTNSVHSFKGYAVDSSGNVNSTDLRTINVSSTEDAAPYFINTENQTVNYGTSFGYQINATDSLGVSCYSVNDTANFRINCSGYLSNNTLLGIGIYSINITVNDTSNNMNSTTLLVNVSDLSYPSITQISPDSSYSNTTASPISISFNCSASDNYNLSNISLYLTDNQNSNLSLNQTTPLNGTSANAVWNLDLTNGNYSWACLVRDAIGYQNWTSNRTIFINFTDSDSDGISDANDALNGNTSSVSKSGVSNLNVTVNGTVANGTFSGSQRVVFYDSSNAIINFTHNFTQSDFDLSKVIITVATNSVIVNLSGQLQANQTKSIFIADNSFTALCAKDEEISDINSITSACTGGNETVLTSCLGNSTGYYVKGLTCIDSGARIEVLNLTHSAIRGTPAVSSGTTGGTGGRGGSSSSWYAPIVNLIERDEYECSGDIDCNFRSGEVCRSHECVKLFDIIINEFDNSVGVGDYFNFKYTAVGMANISDDVVILFSLERNGTVFTSGSDTIYIGNFENKTKESNLLLPSNLESGLYEFYVVLEHGSYKVYAHRTMELLVKDNRIEIEDKTPGQKETIWLLSGFAVFILLVFFVILHIKNKRHKAKSI